MKKDYKKPQVIEVKLVVQNPILANCQETGLPDDQGTCQVSGADCAQPGP